MSGISIGWYGSNGGGLSRAAAQGAIIPVVIGPPGAGGGAGDASVLSLTSGPAPVGAQRGIYVGSDGFVYLATPLTQTASGLSITAAAASSLINVAVGGVITESTWTWTAGPVFLGPTGLPTQIISTAGNLVQIGEALGPTRLRLDPRHIVKLT